MESDVASHTDNEQAKDALRQGLARGDTALAGIAPILSHLLASPGETLVSEDVVARMRGMLRSLASDVLTIEAQASQQSARLDPGRTDALVSTLAKNSVLMSHCYAVAMEGQLTERFEQSGDIDQVLTPLLQELIASPDQGTSELAMQTMSAQARFVQAQRRMHLPLAELPAELFHTLLQLWEALPSDTEVSEQQRVGAVLRESFDEGRSRLGLLTRLTGSLGPAVRATLDLEHAGFALFATGLGRATKQARELTILACERRQASRLVLVLRGAGLKPDEVRRQFMLIHGESRMPSGVDLVSSEDALSMLTGTKSHVRSSEAR